MVSVIQDSVKIIEPWSSNNDMHINANKIKEMVICFHKDRTYNCIDSLSYICIYRTNIERI